MLLSQFIHYATFYVTDKHFKDFIKKGKHSLDDFFVYVLLLVLEFIIKRAGYRRWHYINSNKSRKIINHNAQYMYTRVLLWLTNTTKITSNFIGPNYQNCDDTKNNF